MASHAAAAPAAGRTRYRLPQLTIAWFTGRRAARAGALWGLVFGVYVYDNAFAFRTIAPTAARRDSLLASMARNAGLKALLGDTRQITTLGGFTDWRAIGVTVLVASVWGLMAATKALRGEEAAGRWELFLAGLTTPRRAAANTLAGLGAGVLAMYAMTALLTVLAGARAGIGFSVGQSLLFAVAVVAGAAMFAAVGAVASELMPTRARAASLSAAVFGAAFMLRALGDASASAHWLVYTSPLGWVEQLRPLTGAQPLWLLPILGLVAVCVAATVLLADRDLGDSLLADKDTARPRTALLGSPLSFALRMSWPAIAGWLTATAVAALLYGSLAKSTGQAFASSSTLRKFTGQLAHVAQQQLQLAGTRVFAGIIFLILMTLIMAYVASALGKVREDEAEGYLDNLVVRAVSRQRWLCGRAGLIFAVLVGPGGTAARHRPARARVHTTPDNGRLLGDPRLGVPAGHARLRRQSQPLAHGHLAALPSSPRPRCQPELADRRHLPRARLRCCTARRLEVHPARPPEQLAGSHRRGARRAPRTWVSALVTGWGWVSVTGWMWRWTSVWARASVTAWARESATASGRGSVRESVTAWARGSVMPWARAAPAAAAAWNGGRARASAPPRPPPRRAR
jgi:ABC-2 type transport system permease protein